MSGEIVFATPKNLIHATSNKHNFSRYATRNATSKIKPFNH